MVIETESIGEKVSLDLREYAIKLADGFDAASRMGEDVDEPEGARYVLMSDTLAKEISRQLREHAHG